MLSGQRFPKPGWKIVKRLVGWLLALSLLALGLFMLTPLGRYLARAAVAEAGILLARRPIPEVVADSTTNTVLRRKLELVLAARGFARDSLGMTTGKSFTQFTQLDRDTLVLVLSASPSDALEQYTWWFPVVGRLPYKGFFDYERGEREAQKLRELEYDVILRPAAAFSTLGWFNDPLLSTTVSSDSVNLVDTVIHELTHNTFFAKGQAAFNESFANFAGARGARAFFASRGEAELASEADDRWHDEMILGAYWAQLFRELDSVFRAHPSDKERRLVLRDSVYGSARSYMVDTLAGRLRRVSSSYLANVRLDNAALLARRVYATDLDLFESVLQKEGGGVLATLNRIMEVARAHPENPSAALSDWVSGR